MDRRRGAAVSLCNSTDRLALRIACRNGVPFALRNFGHVYSWFNSISQRGLHASFQGAGSYPLRGIRQTSDVPYRNPAGNLVGEPKAALNEISYDFNHFKIQTRCAEAGFFGFIGCVSGRVAGRGLISYLDRKPLTPTGSVVPAPA